MDEEEETTGWELKDSSTQSCLHVGIDEQCVEKAVEIVSRLKEHLTVWKAERKKPGGCSTDSGRVSRLKMSSATSAPSRNSTVSFYTPEKDNLYVQGLKTGEGRKKFDWSNAEDVMLHVLRLINRLEKDRELTAAKWREERDKVINMRLLLDQKAVERLRILPLLVQQEHERFLKDLLELKWHIAYEGRQLQFIRDEVKLVSDANRESKDNLERTKDRLILLQDKLNMEGDKMAAIIQKQAETEKELKQSENDLTRTAEKAHQTRLRYESEMKQMTRTRRDLKSRLNVALEALSSVKSDQTDLKDQINSFRSNIANLSRERNDKNEKLESLNATRKSIKRQVSALAQQRAEQEGEADQLKDRNITLEKRKTDACLSCTTKDSSLVAEVQQLTREIKETRQLNEYIMCEMDEMKEKTTASQKNFEDSVNSVERARRELLRIDKQLQVVLSQTDSIRDANKSLNEELQAEELKLGSIEDALRTGVQTLKQDYQKELKSKITYQGKIQADKADLEKMTAEHEKSEQKIHEEVKEVQLRRRNSIQKANLLESIHTTKYKDEAMLQEQIKQTREELARVESVLGGKYSTLFEEKTNLDAEVSVKRERVTELQEQRQLLKDRSDDIAKSDKMIQRMEADTLTTIEALECSKKELLDKIEHEKREEESWREELKEITDFSRQSKEKHTHYLIVREKYLHQLEDDELQAAARNRLLADEYRTLTEEHSTLKRSTFQLLEHQLKLEAALKDLGQLLALQMKLSTTMAVYYKNRSLSGIKDLHRFKQEARRSSRRVTEIQTGLEAVLNNISHFLSNHNQAQSELVAGRHSEASSKCTYITKEEDCCEGRLSETERTKAPNKSVSFATPLIECTT